MGHESLVEALGQKLSTASVGHVPVRWVVLEKVSFGLQSIRERSAALDVRLRTVDNTNKAKLQRVYTSRQDIHGVCSVIHEIQLGEDTNCPLAHGVDMASQLQRLRVDKIDVCGGDGEDDTVGLGNVLGDESTSLLLDICRLVADGYLQLLAHCLLRETTQHTLVRPGRSTSVKLRTCGE